jgi:acid phosphatase type 7
MKHRRMLARALPLLSLGLLLMPVRAVASGDPVLVGAGDIASCTQSGDQATAALLGKIGGTVFTLGDNAYETGSPADYVKCFGPTWGRYKSRMHPAPGNHDYFVSHTAAGYFGYFGPQAGPWGKGYYSYNLGAWHVVVLNSECASVGGCGRGSPEERWLRADLAAHPAACTAAYWHTPRFSSGAEYGSDAGYQPFWQALYDSGADVVMVGHEHVYERFAPQTPSGAPDPAFGIRQFTVGTGGESHYGFQKRPVANSQVRNSTAFGVLKLTLHPNSYSWQFVPAPGASFTDSGTAPCHGHR